MKTLNASHAEDEYITSGTVRIADTPNSASPMQTSDDPVKTSSVATVSRADRFMMRVLRVTEIQKSPRVEREAHRGFRVSLVVSGVRCLITYLLVPIMVPILGLAGVVAAPIGILLCLVAGVNGVFSVRKFWVADYRGKWMYTWFIACVFVVLAVGLVTDISRIVMAL